MSIKDLTDNEIAAKMRDLAGKEGVYSDVFCQYANELYDRYFNQGYNIARYYGLSRDDAGDAVQNAFIKLFRSIRNYKPAHDFKPWFFKIVLNSVRDNYRDMKKHRYVDIEKSPDISKDFMEEFHIRETINGIISELPDKLKDVVVLRNYADMTFEMVSLTLGVSIRQLHNRLNKAYVTIRKKLEEGRR